MHKNNHEFKNTNLYNITYNESLMTRTINLISELVLTVHEKQKHMNRVT
jgi:hypothetical protein